MSAPLFIAIEGLSCTGKSTIADILPSVLRMDCARVPTVHDDYTALRKRLAQPEHIDARYLLFLSAIYLAGLEVQEQLNAGRHVLVESYIGRTISFHKGMGASVEVLTHNLRLPDVTFQLLCEPDVRSARCRARGESRHYWDDLAELHTADILRVYGTFPYHTIDTSHIDSAEVARQIAHHPLDGSCNCANGKPVAGYKNLLSPIRE